jgi:hypothetical protein
LREVRLPEAPAEHYLRWMAFWRDVEAAMLERPSLEQVASAQSAPFLRGELARQISDLAGEISAQARVAVAEGRYRLAPVVVLEDGSMIRGIADYVERRGGWLQENAASMAVVPLAPELVLLRTRVVETLRAEAPVSRPA